MVEPVCKPCLVLRTSRQQSNGSIAIANAVPWSHINLEIHSTRRIKEQTNCISCGCKNSQDRHTRVKKAPYWGSSGYCPKYQGDYLYAKYAKIVKYRVPNCPKPSVPRLIPRSKQCSTWRWVEEMKSIGVFCNTYSLWQGWGRRERRRRLERVRFVPVPVATENVPIMKSLRYLSPLASCNPTPRSNISYQKLWSEATYQRCYHDLWLRGRAYTQR